MFEEYFKIKKRLIDQYLIDFLEEQKKPWQKVNLWGEDLTEKLKKFVIAGKTIRGTLVFLSAEMFGLKDEKTILPAAAAMELIQSSLLIHDDIMDRDLKRRGMETIFATYLPTAKKERFSDPFHFAVSMGICAGDIGFFLAMKLLQSPLIKNALADEIMKVCLAQMDDVYWGYKKERPTVAQIEKIYRYKTARYSFSLPLVIGAILAGQSKKTITALERLGEGLGIAFQIKDDIKDKNGVYRYQKEIFLKKLQRLIIDSKKIINQLPVAKKYRELLLGLILRYLLL